MVVGKFQSNKWKNAGNLKVRKIDFFWGGVIINFLKKTETSPLIF